MKRVLLFFATLVVALSVLAVEKTIVANPISATVFLNGAQVEHQVNVPLTRGVNQIRVEGLSPILDSRSIQVALTEGVVVSSFEYSVDYLSSANQNVYIKLLEDSIALYKTQLEQIENALRTNEQMQQLLETGVTHSLNVERVNITSETIDKNLAYFQQKKEKLTTERMSLTKQQTTVKERINTLNMQLQQDKTKNAKRSGVLILSLVAPKSITTSLTVDYFTSRASWTPYYDINLLDISSPMSLVLKANVEQTTGLDWNSINITLSTGAPSKTNTKPELTTKYVSQYMKRTYQVQRYAMASTKARATNSADIVAYDIEDAVEEEAAMGALVTATNQTLDVQYAVQLPYTILGNGKQQTVELQTQTLSKEGINYAYYAAPALSKSVFLCASLKDHHTLSLLNATANITFNGTFYGATIINPSSVEDELPIALGEDKQITVKRELLSQQSVTKTLGSNKSKQQMYKITVRNNKSVPIEITIEDAYPVSIQKEIQVELLSSNTKPTKTDTNKGILTYDLTLQPGEQKELTIGYTIKYPKDWEVMY